MTLEQEVLHYKRMVRLYKFDYLTGLKQRHDFEVETTHKMVNQHFHLAMFDVTGLHNVNRDEGYAAGDALIKQVARDIEMIEGVWEVYRIGGDEFVAILFDPLPEDLAIDTATGAVVSNLGFKNLNEMVAAVDSLVTKKKVQLDRRRP